MSYSSSQRAFVIYLPRTGMRRLVLAANLISLEEILDEDSILHSSRCDFGDGPQ